jgi:hypothetical protein
MRFHHDTFKNSGLPDAQLQPGGVSWKFAEDKGGDIASKQREKRSKAGALRALLTQYRCEFSPHLASRFLTCATRRDQEIPNVPQPEMDPHRTPSPEMPGHPSDPAVPPGPDDGGTTRPPSPSSPPTAPPPVPEHV